MNRHIVRDAGELRRLLPDWFGQSFSFDAETSGLDYVNDRLLGLALTFEDGQSVYIVLAHTVPTQGIVTKQRTEKKLVGYTTVEYLTPKKQIPKTKQVPIYEDLVVEYEEEEEVYPLREFVSQADLARAIGPLFLQRDVVMVAHNAKFDLHFLDRIGVRVAGKLADTMLAAQLINENREVGLKSLATSLLGWDMTEFTDLKRYPGFAKHEFLGVPLEIGADYAMRDTEATWALWQRFAVELVEEGVEHAFRNIWMPMTVVLQQMEAKGISVDLEKVRAVRAQYQQEKDEAEWAIWEEGMKMVLARYPDRRSREGMLPSYARMASATEIENAYEEQGLAWTKLDGTEVYSPLFRPTERSAPRVLTFNPGSNDHLGDLIYDWHKLEPPRNVKLAQTSGGRPVDKNTLKVLKLSLGEKCPPVVDNILKRREAEKFIGTYLDRLLNDADPTDHDCIRTTFNQHVTDTGRLSSTAPNLQNIPSRGERGKQARDMFVARPGMKLIVADYCLHPDTLVETTEGKKRIADVRPGDHVFSLRGRRIVTNEVVRSAQVGWLPSYRVTFDNGESVIASADHRWPVRVKQGRSWVQEERRTDEMVVGQRMIPMRRRVDKRNGYEHLYAYSAFEYSKTHVLVAEAHLGPRPDGHDVRHKDGNKLNNHPSNLEYRSQEAHRNEHTTRLWEERTQEERDHILTKLQEGRRERRDQRGERNPNWGKRHGEDETCAVCGTTFYRPPSRAGRFCSKPCYDAARKNGLNHKVTAIEFVGFQPMHAIEVSPDHNYVLGCGVVTCNSMMELRMAAHYAAKLDPNHAMIRAFNEGMDLHLLTASRQFSVPYEELERLIAAGDTDAKLKRSIGKTSNFGLLYGMGARKFQLYLWVEVGVYLPLDEVQRLIDGFNSTYEAVTEWKGLVVDFIHRRGYVETIAGRKRRLPSIWSRDRYEVMRAERQGINAVIQGSCADIINEAIPAIQTSLAPLGGYMLLQVHDEIVAEAPTEHAEAAKVIVEQYMTTLVNHKLRCPLVADAGIGSSWADAKK